MKIYDCFSYWDEDLLVDLRLNILDKDVDYFVIVEGNKTWQNNSKNLQFDIEKFKKFKDKIIYIPVEDMPDGDNPWIRENFQRNCITRGLKNSGEDDLIIISDADEIPNLNNIKNYIKDKRYAVFKQKAFYYKLNMKNVTLPDWYGSRICKKRYLKSPQWLRNVKNKKYPIYRLDILFSDKKYNNVHIVHNGGWHFTNVMSEEKIIYKLKSYLHHADFPENLLNKETFQELIKQKKIMYDHSVDKSGDRFSNRKELSIFENNLLPEYLQKNLKKFKEWLV